MTDQDIVQRLRAPVDQPMPFARKAEREEAASEIERLRLLLELDSIQRWTEAANEIDRLNEECFALAANQCQGGYGDGYGNHRCKYQDEIERLCAGIIDYLDGNHTAMDGNGNYVETGEYFAALINPKGQRG